MRRAVFSILAIALTSALVASCGGRTRSSPKLAHLKSMSGIAFDYPASWRLLVAVPGRNALFTHYGPDTIAFLGAQPLHGPCRSRKIPGGTSTTCNKPIRRLRPGSVLVTVFAPGSPDAAFANAPGKSETIAGRRAKVSIGRPGAACRELGADEAFIASIAAARGGFYELDVCLRRPQLAAREREVRALLASIAIP